MSIMKTRGGINHVDLNVTDPKRSAAFYDRILGYMGYQRSRISTPENPGHDWFASREGASRVSIGIVRAKSDTPHDRTATGLQHLAFHAESREDVDGLYRLLLEMKAVILDPPAEYPKYEPGYYAVFFLDPDGIKLEFVLWPEPK